jgi:hypothetical protein
VTSLSAIPAGELGRFERIVRSDPGLMRLLACLRELELPQWQLVAGCLYQTVWNVLTNRPRGTGIKDYDVIYFDDSDLSWEAENRVIGRVAAATRGGVDPVEVRNQARVHLWFERRFGCRYPALASADEALRRYASVVHAIGVRLEADGRLAVAAPFGLDDLFAMVIRPNPVLDNRVSHREKARRAQRFWPEVAVLPWAEIDAPTGLPAATADARRRSSRDETRDENGNMSDNALQSAAAPSN